MGSVLQDRKHERRPSTRSTLRLSRWNPRCMPPSSRRMSALSKWQEQLFN